MKTGRLILAASLLLGAATAAAAQDSPLRILEQLMRPPLDAVTNAFRPPARPKTEPKKAETVDLLSVPMPRPRPANVPDETDTGPALGYAPATKMEAAPLVPEPHPRPPLPAVASIAPDKPMSRPPPAVDTACGAAIARLGVEATPLAAISEGACGIPQPVAVKGLGGGAIDFTTKAVLGCELAETLARWTNDKVQPLALKAFGKPVTGYRIAASYACRNRDGLPNTKLSEHAKGKAVDISAFRVDGEWIEVKSGWNTPGTKAAFLRAVRKSACGPFTTVLGPGSDSFHTDHFHLDRAQRRTAGPSKGLYCH